MTQAVAVAAHEPHVGAKSLREQLRDFEEQLVPVFDLAVQTLDGLDQRLSIEASKVSERSDETAVRAGERGPGDVDMYRSAIGKPVQSDAIAADQPLAPQLELLV